MKDSHHVSYSSILFYFFSISTKWYDLEGIQQMCVCVCQGKGRSCQTSLNLLLREHLLFGLHLTVGCHDTCLYMQCFQRKVLGLIRKGVITEVKGFYGVVYNLVLDRYFSFTLCLRYYFCTYQSYLFSMTFGLVP